MLNDKCIKKVTFTATTSANGNNEYTFSNKVVVLSATSASADVVVFPYPSTTAGSTTWYFHTRQALASHSPVASQSVTVTAYYIDA